MKCTTCGFEIEANAEVCENCGRPQKKTVVRERVILGMIGALLGAAVGAACYIALSQMGILAACAGLLLALLVLLGYAALGRRVGAFGGVFCALLLLIVPFAADWADWSLVLMRQAPEYDLPAALVKIPYLLADGSIVLNSYVTNLAMLYGFILAGAVIFIIIRAVIRHRRTAAVTGRRARHRG